MTWLLDLGNTRLKAAELGVDDTPGALIALAHAEPGFSEQLRLLAARIGSGADAWLASVASPTLTEQVSSALQQAGISVCRATVRTDGAGLDLAAVEAGQLGVDRFLGVLGALSLGRGAALVVSIGSAVTVDLVDAAGRHGGGVIAPTPEHQQQALAERFPALARRGGRMQPLAGNTADAVVSGTLAATLGLIERCHRQATQRLGEPPAVLLTGGGAEAIAGWLDLPHRIEPALVLRGLARYVRAQERDA